MVVVLTGIFAGIAWLQTQSLALLNASSVYQGDNVVWSFYQLETEYLRLREMMRMLANQPAPAREDALRERYEIFVSRIGLIKPERTQIAMPVLPAQVQVLADLNALVVLLDPVLGPDAPELIDPQTARRLLPKLEQVALPVRDLSLLANQAVAESITGRNEAVRQQNRIGIGLTVLQCLLILVFAVIVVRQVRALEQRRLALEELARNLHEARAEAEQASRAKSAFLANMSHELRTPFNGLLGMMSLLDRSVLSASQREYLSIARQSGEHLLAILNDVLDFSKMESGRLELVPQPVDLQRLVHDVQALMLPQARIKNLQFDVTLAPELHAAVQADAKRVKQILFNLLGNAIKFTDAGRVSLLVDQIDGTDSARVTRIRVRDTGIGMSEETRAHLFQRFSQGDSSINRRFGGTGLGLEISRALAHMMGGEISVSSQVGQGSEFTVLLNLPLLSQVSMAPAPQAAEVQGDTGQAVQASYSPAAEFSGVAPAAGRVADAMRTLVTDDHPVNRRFMQALLERLGHEVVLATNGEEALALARHQLFDLVLMDVHMPVMDGLAATRAIRQLPLPYSRVPIIALTADAFAESREHVRQAGMDDFLAKPVQLHDVEEMLRKHFGARAVTGGGVVRQQAGTPATAVPALSRPGGGESANTASPAAPAAKPSSSTAAARTLNRIKRGEVARVLDLNLISDTCVAVTADGYRSLVSGFLKDQTRTIADLVDLLEQGQPPYEGGGAMAHRLKGAAANLGLRQLADTARETEQQFGAGMTAEAAGAAARRLREVHRLTDDICTRMGWAGAD